MLSQIIWGFVITVILGVIVIIILGLPIFLRWLAEEDEKTGKKAILFATVQEGQARSIEWNRKFHRFIMSYAGYCFLGELKPELESDQHEYWEVVKDNRPPKRHSLLGKIFNLPAYNGLHFLGLPFIARIPQKRFTWVEWDWLRKPGGSVTTEKGPIPHEEPISHILVQGDVYFVQVAAAETKEGVPVDVKILFTINICNPYKAQYRAQDWLELVTNQAEGDVRTFVGTEKILQMLTVTAGDQEGVAAVTISDRSKAELEAVLANGLKRYRDDYGVNVSLSQIQSVELVGPDAGKYRALVTKQFEADMEARGVMTAADAEAYRIRKTSEAEGEAITNVLGTVAGLKDGASLFRSQQIGKLKELRTLVEGGSNTGTVVSTDTK